MEYSTADQYKTTIKFEYVDISSSNDSGTLYNPQTEIVTNSVRDENTMDITSAFPKEIEIDPTQFLEKLKLPFGTSPDFIQFEKYFYSQRSQLKKIKAKLSEFEGKLIKLENEKKDLELRFEEEKKHKHFLSEKLKMSKKNEHISCEKLNSLKKQIEIALKSEENMLSHRDVGNLSIGINVNKFQAPHSNSPILRRKFEDSDSDYIPNKLKKRKSRSTSREILICGKYGCGKTFVSKAGLRQHELGIHRIGYTTYKGFFGVCPFCAREFRSRQALEGHKNAHEGIKPYKCPDCKYKSSFKGNLSTHRRHFMGNCARISSINSA